MSNPATQADVIRLMRKVAAAFPHANLIPEAYEVYAEALAGIPLDVLHAVVIQTAQSGEFFPTLHRIRECLTDVLCAIPIPEVAWEEVVEWKQRKREKFSHPLIARVVDMMGGWWHLSRSENESIDRAQFLSMYRGLREADRQEMSKTPALKLLEQNNGEMRALPSGEQGND